MINIKHLESNDKFELQIYSIVGEGRRINLKKMKLFIRFK